MPRPCLEVRKEDFLPSLFCPLFLCYDSERASQLALALVVVSPIWIDTHWIGATTTNHIMSYQTANRWYQLPLAANAGCNHTGDLKVERLFITLPNSTNKLHLFTMGNLPSQ